MFSYNGYFYSLWKQTPGNGSRTLGFSRKCKRHHRKGISDIRSTVCVFSYKPYRIYKISKSKGKRVEVLYHTGICYYNQLPSYFLGNFIIKLNTLQPQFRELTEVVKRVTMLEIKNLTKIYHKNRIAVNNINLKVSQGDIYGFIGTNGSGKTSTIKSIVGIHDFTGEIYVNGISIKDNPVEFKKNIAYIPDNPDIYEYLTGRQYINFIADLYRVSINERIQKTKSFSEIFEMSSFLDNTISSYSHGMKQKIVIIAALIHSPKLLIMDEPFVGLDPKACYLLKKEMKILVESGNAIFFSTHVLEVAEKLCNKIGIINKGRLIVQGNINTVLSKTDSLEEYFMDIIKNEKYNNTF